MEKLENWMNRELYYTHTQETCYMIKGSASKNSSLWIWMNAWMRACVRACVFQRREKKKEREWESKYGTRAKETYMRYFYKQVYIYIHTHIFQQRILKKKKKRIVYTRVTQIRLNIYIYIYMREISQKCVITSKYIYIYTTYTYKAKRRTICTLTCEPNTDKIEEKRGWLLYSR